MPISQGLVKQDSGKSPLREGCHFKNMYHYFRRFYSFSARGLILYQNVAEPIVLDRDQCATVINDNASVVLTLDQEYIDCCVRPIFSLSFSCFIQQLLMTLINLSGKFKFKAMI